MEKLFIPYKNQSLLFQLIYLVGVITTLVLALLGGYRYQQQSQQLAAELDSLLKSSTNFLATSLEVPIYNYDLLAAEGICGAVIQIKEVIYVGVEEVMGANLVFVKNEQGKIERDTSSIPISEVIWLREEIIQEGKKIGIVAVGVTKKYLNNSLALTLKLTIIQIIVLAFLLVVPLVMLLRSRFVIPIQKLTMVSSLMAQGDLEKTFVSYRNDELGELAKTFSSMQGNIKEKIKDLNNEVTERKQAEDSLRILRNYLSNIIDSMPSALIGVDVEGKVTQWNCEAVRLTGITEKKALGQPLKQSFPRLSIDMIHVSETIQSCQKKVIPKREYQQDGVIRYEDMTIYPLSANGVDGAVIRLDDITEKNINEMALRRSQKLEAIGQLTGGIAHDFNNILGIIMGNLQLLEMELAGNDVAVARIHKALKGTKRGSDITRQLLRFSRNQTKSTTQVNINKIIRNMDELITKSLTVSIEVQTHLQEELWLTNIDPGDLEDAILNLSLNAKDAMPNGGTLIIETSNKVLDDSYARCNPSCESGDFVMISVSDNGMGMSDKVKDKVLEPFFTTKDQGKGTGLGLSMVYGFARRSGGDIKIYSELGKGTTFHILLPRSEEEALPESVEEYLAPELPRGTETILIVDDEEGLVDIAVEHLQFLGYSVLTASCAEQALNVIKSHSNIDLVFSDIIMPGGVDGYQLSETIHKENNEIRILLASGFTKRREDFLNRDNAFLLKLREERLHKPYSLSELAVAIRHILDEK